MRRPHVITLSFVARSRAAAVSIGRGVGPGDWADPQDPESQRAREAESRALRRGLAAAAPGLQSIDDQEDRASFLADLLADGVPPDVASARLRRRIAMIDPPSGPEGGGLFVEVADLTATASLTVSDFGDRDATAAQVARLEAVAVALRDLAGLAVCDPATHAPLGADEARRFFAGERQRLISLARAEARRDWLWFAGAQALAALLVGGLWAAAVRDAQFHTSIDMERPLTLLVEGRAPVRYAWGFVAQHPVLGRVTETGAAAEAVLYRREWQAARKGSRLMVFDAGLGGGRMASVADVARAAPVVAIAGVGVPTTGALAAALGAAWLAWLGRIAFVLDASRRRGMRARLASLAPALLRVAAFVIGVLAAVLAIRRAFGFA